MMNFNPEMRYSFSELNTYINDSIKVVKDSHNAHYDSSEVFGYDDEIS